jgi:hypothetical protein
MVLEKPKGSWIEEQITPDAYILKWRLPALVWPLEVKDVLLGFLLLGSMGALFGLGKFGWDWAGILWGILWGILLVLSPLLVLFLMMGLRSFRRGRPEVLTLGADSFRHDLGRPGGWLANYDSYCNREIGHPKSFWRWSLGPPFIVELPKEGLGQVVVERVTGKLRLRYDLGADQIEIGRYLSEPEKEWLAKVIREWQG